MKAATVFVTLGLGLIILYHIITPPNAAMSVPPPPGVKDTTPNAAPKTPSTLGDFYEHMKNRYASLFDKPNVRAILD
jgi:hypothetical protein